MAVGRGTRPKLLVLASTGTTALTNVAVPLMVQAADGLSALGAFTLAAIPLTLMLAVSRHICQQTVLQGSSSRGVPNLLRAWVGLGVAASALTSVIVFLLELAPAFHALAMICPLALTQDVFRHRCFGVGQPVRALVSDTAWLLVLVGPLPFLAAGPGEIDLETVMLTYTVGGFVSVAVALLRWPRATSGVSIKAPVWATTIEALFLFSMLQVSVLVVGAMGELSVVGIMKSALIAVAPASFLQNYFMSTVVPKLGNDDRTVVRQAAGVGFAVLASAVLCIVVVTLAPMEWLQALGFPPVDVLSSFIAAMLVLGLGFAFGTMVSVALVRLRDKAPPRLWLPPRLFGAALEPALTIPAALLLGPAGLAAHLLVTNLLFVSALIARVRMGREWRHLSPSARA